MTTLTNNTEFDTLMEAIEAAGNTTTVTNTRNNSIVGSVRTLLAATKTTIRTGVELTNEIIETGADIVSVLPETSRFLKAFVSTLSDYTQAYFNGLSYEEQLEFMEAYSALSDEQRAAVNKQRSAIMINKLIKLFSEE